MENKGRNHQGSLPLNPKKGWPESLKDFPEGKRPIFVGFTLTPQIYIFNMEQQNETPKKSRGGRREGAGRPRGNNNFKSIALRIPQDVAAILDRQPNRSAYIINAIRHYAATFPELIDVPATTD